MSAWPTRRLGDIAKQGQGEIRTGPFGSQLHRYDYTDALDGVPVIMPVNMVGGRVNREGIAKVSPTKAAEMAVHVTQPGDVLLSRRGDIGRYCLIDTAIAGALCGTGSLRVSIQGTELLPEYLCMFLETRAGLHELQGKAVGSTMPNINSTIVGSLELPLPPVPTQRKIAAILTAYDDLIENNNRRIKLLEEMAQRIYREWFVDFRYPGHENVPVVDSELGPIPQEWSVRRLGGAVEFVYGKALKAESRRDGEVTVFGSGGVIGHHDEALAEGPGIVVGRKGNVGSVYWSDGAFFAIDTTYWIRSALPLTYCYYVLRDMDFLDSHAAVPGLSREQAYSLPLVVPDSKVVAIFDDFAVQLFSWRRRIADASDNLRVTRDLLLPRLISGEVDVTDLDIAMAEDAA